MDHRLIYEYAPISIDGQYVGATARQVRYLQPV
jgi:hypothetical protein